jgi:hypothetical protein
MIVLKTKNKDDGLFVPCRLSNGKIDEQCVSRENRIILSLFFIFLRFFFSSLLFLSLLLARIFALSLSRLHMSIRLMLFRIIFSFFFL